MLNQEGIGKHASLVGPASTFIELEPPIQIQIMSITTAYFVRTKIQRQRFFMKTDSGCNHFILPRMLFHHSPVSATPLRPIQWRGTLADGTPLALDGSMTLSFSIESPTFDTDFLVVDVGNTILLGLDFFDKQGCTIDFYTCTFIYVGTNMQCTDAQCEPLQANVQLRSETRIPRRTERIISAQLNTAWTQGPAFVEPSSKT